MSSNRLYGLTVHLIRLYARFMLKPDTPFRGPVPPGPKLFVASHPNASDPFFIYLLSSKHLSVLLSGNAFAMPLFGYPLHHCRQISVIPGQGKEALDLVEQRLRSAQSVGIFPEGLVSPR